MTTDTTAPAALGAPDGRQATLEQLVEEYGYALTPSEAAGVLRCHPSHVRAMCQDGRLRAVRFGERWRIPAAALAELVG